VVVKTQRPHRLRPRTSLSKEAALLRALAQPLAGRVPKVFGSARVDIGTGPVEFIVMSRIEGSAVVHQVLDIAARHAVLADLAAVLRAVHATDPANLDRELGDQPLPADQDAEALRRRLESGFADLVQRLDMRPAAWTARITPAEAARQALELLPGGVHQPVVLHSNPGRTHTFADSTGRFTGLIDFGDAYISHPALDLRSWPDPQDRRVLRECYLDGTEASAAWQATWQVVMVLADMAAIAGGTEDAPAAVADLIGLLGGR